MNRKLVGVCLLGLILIAGSSWARPTEEEYLAVLADQAFQKMHQVQVTLPDFSSERLARSTDSLPRNWPKNQPKGLVERRFVEEAIAAVGLAALDQGVWIAFSKPGEFDLLVLFKRSELSGEIKVLKPTTSCWLDECLIVSPLDCEDGEGTETCNCHGANCDSCSTETTEYNSNAEDGSNPEVGGTFSHITENSEETREVCSVGSIGGTVTQVTIF